MYWIELLAAPFSNSRSFYLFTLKLLLILVCLYLDLELSLIFEAIYKAYTIIHYTWYLHLILPDFLAKKKVYKHVFACISPKSLWKINANNVSQCFQINRCHSRNRFHSATTFKAYQKHTAHRILVNQCH